MESSRRDLFIDMVVRKFTLKNNQITLSPCFTFIPKIRVGLIGVSFYCNVCIYFKLSQNGRRIGNKNVRKSGLYSVTWKRCLGKGWSNEWLMRQNRIESTIRWEREWTWRRNFDRKVWSPWGFAACCGVPIRTLANEESLRVSRRGGQAACCVVVVGGSFGEENHHAHSPPPVSWSSRGSDLHYIRKI